MRSLLLGMAVGFCVAAIAASRIADSVHLLALALATACVAMLCDKR